MDYRPGGRIKTLRIVCLLLFPFFLRAERIALLTYPFSDSSWIMYNMIQLSSRGFLVDDDSFHNFGISINDEPPFLHVFQPIEINYFNPKCDKLILLIKDYREVLINYLESTGEEIHRWLDRMGHSDLRARSVQDPDWYFHNLYLYDQWNPQNRLLIYYEDLINHPKLILKKLLDFVGGSDYKLNRHIENLAIHHQYFSKFRPTHRIYSEGFKGLKIDLSPSLESKIKNKFSKAYPSLYEKYLKRYDGM
ncbi:MAG: sulfotransferase domain-containing protein [Simkaniaceae bacterium]